MDFFEGFDFSDLEINLERSVPSTTSCPRR